MRAIALEIAVKDIPQIIDGLILRGYDKEIPPGRAGRLIGWTDEPTLYIIAYPKTRSSSAVRSRYVRERSYIHQGIFANSISHFFHYLDITS